MHFDSIPGLIDASRRDAAHRTGHGEKKRGGKRKREGREGRGGKGRAEGGGREGLCMNGREEF